MWNELWLASAGAGRQPAVGDDDVQVPGLGRGELATHLATREDALGALEHLQGLASLVTRRMGPECAELDNPGNPNYL